MVVTVSSLMSSIMSSTKGLSLKQLIQIRNVLELELADVEITKKCYELSVINNNDRYIKEYVSSLKLAGKSDKTIKQYVSALKNMLEVVQKDVVDIKKADLKRYYAWYSTTHNISSTTLQNLQRYISPFFRFLAMEEYIDINPAQFIEPPKIKKPDIDPFTGEELEIIRESCSIVSSVAELSIPTPSQSLQLVHHWYS